MGETVEALDFHLFLDPFLPHTMHCLNNKKKKTRTTWMVDLPFFLIDYVYFTKFFFALLYPVTLLNKSNASVSGVLGFDEPAGFNNLSVPNNTNCGI